jgi:Flp pilus assembly secretin CpaC
MDAGLPAAARSQSHWKWRLRFRVSTFLWMMVVVSAFFVGRRSDAIKTFADNWSEVTRVWLGGNVRRGYEVSYWPPASITINEDVPIKAIVVSDPTVVDAKLSSPRQLRISPKSTGETIVSYTVPGGKYKNAELQLKITPDEQFPGWTLEHR